MAKPVARFVMDYDTAELPSAEYKRRCIAVKRGKPGFKAWSYLLECYGFRCAYCDRRPLGIIVPFLSGDSWYTSLLEIEHVVPLAKGGAKGFPNIVPACKDCNGHKRTLSLEEWLDTPWEVVQFKERLNDFIKRAPAFLSASLLGGTANG